MTLKNNSFNSFTQQISNKVLLKEKLNNDKNILKLKYLFKYLGFKKKKLIVKVRHNKIFLLKIKKKNCYS